MNTPNKSGLFRSPSGTPNGKLNNNQKRNQYLYGKDEDLQNAIDILLVNSNNNIFNEFKNDFHTMNFDSRTAGVNPNSAICMDKTN